MYERGKSFLVAPTIALADNVQVSASVTYTDSLVADQTNPTLCVTIYSDVSYTEVISTLMMTVTAGSILQNEIAKIIEGLPRHDRK